MTNDRIQQLLIRYFKEECTPSEKRELALWIQSLGNEEDWQIRLQKIWEQYNVREKPKQERLEAILKEILADKDEDKPKVIPMPPRSQQSGMMKWAMVAAAAIAALIMFSLIYFVPNPNEQHPVAQKVEKETNKILPGSNKATLTLANGQQIILDSASTGALKTAGNTKVIKVKNGLLSYKKSQISDLRSQIAYNTISTPRGGQYQVILPDGSKVWLNAASSLKFPTAFKKGKREIFVKGEVYAEVAKNKNKPFIVHILSPSGADKGTVKVLGTSFDVNAYQKNAPAKTTLIEGAVKISLGGNEKILIPGDQALIGKEQISIKKDVNTVGIIAWKNGLFDFSGTSIKEVMQRISRWYDVQIKYENMPSVRFMGTISRSSNVSDVLKMLEMTGVVHFIIEGKTITVTR